MTQRPMADPENRASCPSCGQPLTKQHWCPHCGAERGGRLRLSVLRYASLLTALVGTALVWMVARSTKVPTVRIADVRSDMDWAYVQLLGVVSRHPYHEPSSGELVFWIDDGSGETRVTAYRPVSDRLLEASQVPAIGDRVSVEGTLRLREDLRQLVVSLPSGLAIDRPTPVASSVADLTEERLFGKVCLRGQVRGKRVPYDGLVVVALRDITGAVDVVAEEGLGAAYAAALSLGVGEYVELCGTVTTYAGKLQVALEPHTVAAVRLAATGIAPPREAAQVGYQDIGQFVRVAGTIAGVARIGPGVRLLVEDDSGALTVVVWQDVVGSPEALDTFVEGNRLEVQGQVAEYQGQLEIIPEIAGDVLHLAMASEATPQLRLSQLDPERVGDTVTVAAQIVYSVPCPSGVRFALRDGDAEGYLLAWSGWLAACPVADRLIPGAEIRIRGVVSLYGNGPEVVPQHPDDVTVTGMSALPEIATGSSAEPALQQASSADGGGAEATQSTAMPTRQPSPTPAASGTGGVASGVAGKRLTVQGTLVDLVLFASGQRCQIDDGSGPLALWLPSDPFAELYGRPDWRFGNVVRVQGLVQLYQGEVELVPGGLGDVSIVASVPDQPESVTRMAELRESHVGKRLTVEGRVVEVKPFSQGVKYLLDDGSGRLTVILWQSVLDDLQGRECLALGSLVRATGRISAYQGALELAPGVGRDVHCMP